MASPLFEVHMKRFALIAVKLVAFTGSASVLVLHLLQPKKSTSSNRNTI